MMNSNTNTHRPRVGTVAQLVQTHQAVQKALPQPIRELTPEAQAFFERIILSRESVTWSPFDLAAATLLAETEAQVVAAMQTLQTEGRTVETARGLSQHPEVKTLSSLSGSARSLATQLGLSAAQRQLTGPQALRNNSELAARQVQGQSAHSSFA